jgi:hypothetical protein
MPKISPVALKRLKFVSSNPIKTAGELVTALVQERLESAVTSRLLSKESESEDVADFVARLLGERFKEICSHYESIGMLERVASRPIQVPVDFATDLAVRLLPLIQHIFPKLPQEKLLSALVERLNGKAAVLVNELAEIVAADTTKR